MPMSPDRPTPGATAAPTRGSMLKARWTPPAEGHAGDDLVFGTPAPDPAVKEPTHETIAPEEQQPPAGVEKPKSPPAETTTRPTPPPDIPVPASAELVKDLEQLTERLSAITDALKALDGLLHQSLDAAAPPSATSPLANLIPANSRQELWELLARQLTHNKEPLGFKRR